MPDRLEIDALEELALAFRALDDAPARRRRRPSRPLGLAIVAALLVTGSAAAGVALLREGPPFPDVPRGDLASRERSVPGSDALADARAADPAGGLPWGMRVSKSETGERCMTVGQVLDGRVGRVEDGEFRALALLGPGGCEGPFAPGQAISGQITGAGTRAVAHGFAVPGVESIEIRAGDGRMVRVRPGADRSYLAVFEGLPQLAYTVRFADGRVLVLDPAAKEPVDVTPRTVE